MCVFACAFACAFGVCVCVFVCCVSCVFLVLVVIVISGRSAPMNGDIDTAAAAIAIAARAGAVVVAEASIRVAFLCLGKKKEAVCWTLARISGGVGFKGTGGDRRRALQFS